MTDLFQQAKQTAEAIQAEPGRDERRDNSHLRQIPEVTIQEILDWAAGRLPPDPITGPEILRNLAISRHQRELQRAADRQSWRDDQQEATR